MSVLLKIFKKQAPGRIKLNTRTGYYFVDPLEIFYVEADGNYSRIYLINGKSETSTISLGSVEKIIKDSSLLRVSRSYIINMQYISRVDRKLNLCELEYNGIARQLKIPASKIKLLEAYY
jgi:two-component system LytT family response regulator